MQAAKDLDVRTKELLALKSAHSSAAEQKAQAQAQVGQLQAELQKQAAAQKSGQDKNASAQLEQLCADYEKRIKVLEEERTAALKERDELQARWQQREKEQQERAAKIEQAMTVATPRPPTCPPSHSRWWVSAVSGAPIRATNCSAA